MLIKNFNIAPCKQIRNSFYKANFFYMIKPYLIVLVIIFDCRLVDQRNCYRFLKISFYLLTAQDVNFYNQIVLGNAQHAQVEDIWKS